MDSKFKKSLTPQFKFSNNLEEQKAELATNPLMERFAQSRAKFAIDQFRPTYHFVSPECSLNDPNGLCF